METRPFHKRLLGFLKPQPIAPVQADIAGPKTAANEFPLSPPKPPKEPLGRGAKATKGAFGKCRYRVAEASTDPRFNHALRKNRRR